MQVRDPATLAWKRPGTLPLRVVGVVVVACVVIVVAALAGGHLLDAKLHRWWPVNEPCRDCRGGYVRVWIDPWSLRYGLPLGLAIGMVVAFLPRFSLSRWVRLAVLLPLALLAAAVVVWDRWPVIASVSPGVVAPLADSLSTGWVLVAAIAWTAVAGWFASKRPRDWLHATVMVALVGLLLVGLWLPIAAVARAARLEDLAATDDYDALLLSPGVVVTCVLPPLAAALSYAHVAMRKPAWVREHRRELAVALGIFTVISIAFRFGSTYDAALIYVNCIPVLLALAGAAVLGLAALGADVAIRAGRAHRLLAADSMRRTGTLASDGPDPIIARIEITSWLRGPRAVIRPCVVASARGDIAIDAGAEIALPIPALSTHLAVGESLELARTGDAMAVAGLVPPSTDHPFRDSVALVPGPHGVVIGDPSRPVRGFAHVALAIWRPCLAYLVIVIAVAIIGLAGMVEAR